MVSRSRMFGCHHGKKTIEETQIIRLAVEDQRAIAEAILKPPPLAPAMERAITRYHNIIKTSR